MAFTVIVFLFVYAAMFLGGVPGLALDRTGAALLGAVVLIVGRAASPEDAWQAVDVSTIVLLFGMMVVSAQLRVGGFYTWATRGIIALTVSPSVLLALLIAIASALAALLTNDVICLAMTPIVIDGCGRRGLNPVPYLIGLACSTNIGSALTLIGNPQNILVGQALDLSFADYTLKAAVPVAGGLLITWLVIRWSYRHAWEGPTRSADVEGPSLDRWHTLKGLLIIGAVVVFFVVDSVEREVVTLAAAGLILTSRRVGSRETLGLVDWHLLVLFIGLFVVNGALAQSGATEDAVAYLTKHGVDLREIGWLFGSSVVLSNLVSNVPATMLLLPVAVHPESGAVLALSSTLAGNLLIVGSIANIIVVEQARLAGIALTWKEHAKIGVPVTALSLGLAAACVAAAEHF